MCHLRLIDTNLWKKKTTCIRLEAIKDSGLNLALGYDWKKMGKVNLYYAKRLFCFTFMIFAHLRQIKWEMRDIDEQTLKNAHNRWNLNEEVRLSTHENRPMQELFLDLIYRRS